MALVTAFVALFTITNPVGNIPLFLTLTANQTPRQQRATAWTAAFAVAVILVICLFVGQIILRLFGIRIEAFTLAGSFVVATLAWSMLSIQTSGQRHTEQEKDEAVSKPSITVVPLAIPILAGPGAISTVISSATNLNFVEKAFGTGVILAVAAAVGVILSLAVDIRRILGVSGMNVLTRIFGLILLSIAVGSAAGALVKIFPALCGR